MIIKLYSYNLYLPMCLIFIQLQILLIYTILSRQQALHLKYGWTWFIYESTQGVNNRFGIITDFLHNLNIIKLIQLLDSKNCLKFFHFFKKIIAFVLWSKIAMIIILITSLHASVCVSIFNRYVNIVLYMSSHINKYLVSGVLIACFYDISTTVSVLW